MKNNIDDYIDYKVGDWVETCHIMPGIVQVIDKTTDTVEIYYPHYKKKCPDYNGGSCCSICHCGVHKIDSELANAFLIVGEERATRVYNFLQRNFHIKSIEKSIKYWKELKEEWKQMFPKKLKQLYESYNSNHYYRRMFIECNIHKINNVNDFRKYKIESIEQYIKEKEEDLFKVWQDFDKFYHETIKNLANNVINDTTKGIWLSYQKHTLERYRNGKRLIELVETGERFLAKKIRKKYYLIEKMN